jgi:hypothetical protein
MHDIIDVIKNIQILSENNSAFSVLKDFEKVFDELDIYVFKNWESGELLSGPKISRYGVECSFMWPKNIVPDPQGGKRLEDYGCRVTYKKEHILIPRKIKDPEDFRPGTKKGKIDAHPVWVITVDMPKKLIQDVSIGKENKENYQLAELMRYNSNSISSPTEIPQEPTNVQPPAV